MPKLKLNAEPTFKAKVLIPIPGGAPVPVEFTFKHRNREDFSAWLKSLEDDDKAKPQAVLDIALGWDLDDQFNEATVTQLLSNYIGAFQPILDKYMDELIQAKQKN